MPTLKKLKLPLNKETFWASIENDALIPEAKYLTLKSLYSTNGSGAMTSRERLESLSRDGMVRVIYKSDSVLVPVEKVIEFSELFNQYVKWKENDNENANQEI